MRGYERSRMDDEREKEREEEMKTNANERKLKLIEGGAKVEEKVMQQMTPEQMKAAIEASKVQRQQACGPALQKVLEQHGCELQAQIVLRQGQVLAQVLLVAKD